MATINNPNDQSRTTQNVTQPTPSSSGTPTASGGYSTLQKYLQANQNAGQRIGGMLGGNLNKELESNKTSATRELGEVDVANKAFGDLTNKTSAYQQQLSQPGTGTSIADQSKAYDVNQYSAKLSGQQAAADIAKNNLEDFTKVRTDQYRDERKAQSDKEANEALQQSLKTYDTNLQRQKQLSSFGGRNTLLQDALNSKNQRTGLKNLDTAFLTQDKTKTLDQLQQNLQTQTKGLQDIKSTAETKLTDVSNLNEAQLAAQNALSERLTGMQSEYGKVLQDRVEQVNKAKAEREVGIRNAWDKFKQTGQITQDMYDLLQLGNVMDTDAAMKDQGIVTAQKTTPNAGQGIRLFNELQNQDLNSLYKNRRLLDIETLSQKALQGSDVANAQDVEALNNLAALMGSTNNVAQSKFVGSQIGESALDEKLNDAALNFINNVSREETFKYGDDDQKDSRNRHYGYSEAKSNLADYLYGNGIARRTGYGRSGMDSDIDKYADVASKEWTKEGGNEARYWGSDNAQGAVSYAEAEAIKAVQNELNDKINQIGYNNLLRLVGGSIGEE